MTAFGPFPNTPYNPTPRLAERVAARLGEGEDPLAGWVVECRTLDTAWRAPPELLAELSAKEPGPDVILALGVSGSAETVRVERWAVNEATGKTPDVVGRLAETAELVSGGPARLEGLLHRGALAEVTQAAQSAGYPVVFSDSAGTYLCNALFYHLLDAFERLAQTRLVGFVHVPQIAEPNVDGGPNAGLGEDVIVETLVTLAKGWCESVATT